MKGTAARGDTADDDRDRAERLRSSPKERAENLMIVDQTRNDLSRIVRVGSIDVPGLFVLERLADGLAADVGDRRPHPARRRAGGRVPCAVPVRLGPGRP